MPQRRRRCGLACRAGLLGGSLLLLLLGFAAGRSLALGFLALVVAAGGVLLGSDLLGRVGFLGTLLGQALLFGLLLAAVLGVLLGLLGFGLGALGRVLHALARPSFRRGRAGAEASTFSISATSRCASV